jgi:hypothetical protein
MLTRSAWTIIDSTRDMSRAMRETYAGSGQRGRTTTPAHKEEAYGQRAVGISECD